MAGLREGLTVENAVRRVRVLASGVGIVGRDAAYKGDIVDASLFGDRLESLIAKKVLEFVDVLAVVTVAEPTEAPGESTPPADPPAPPADPAATTEDEKAWSRMTKSELVALASERGIAMDDAATKAQIIAALMASQ